MMQNRLEESKEVIFRLHSTKGDDSFAAQEFEDIKRQTAIDQQLETSWVSFTCLSLMSLPRIPDML